MSDCPLINHLACKLPGELEPRIYDVYVEVTVAAGAFLPSQFVDIANRDAPWHCASIGIHTLSGTANLYVRPYNSRGFGISDSLVRGITRFGGVNSARPVMPSLVWPVNSSLMFDLQNTSVGDGTWGLWFFGFKIFDRGKAPC